MLIDFSQVSDEQNVRELLPEGKTLLKVTSCESVTSKNGNEMWVFIYEDKDGNKIWDNLVFTPNTFNRVKKCFSNLGLDVSGKFDYQPEDVIGLFMNAEIKIEDYEYNGKKGQKNTIDLWQSEKYQAPAKKSAPKKVVEDDSIPF